MSHAETLVNIKENGFAIADNFFDPRRIWDLEQELKDIGAFDFSNTDLNTLPLLKRSKAVSAIAHDELLLELLRGCSCREIAPVNAVILDKSSRSNWEIPWHQDLTIAVHEKVEVEGYINWNILAGINHVQPPVTILERMITVRIHFDACLENNGAISVIPGSQRHGVLARQAIIAADIDKRAVLCEVGKYGVMFMKPLLLHNSPYSKNASRRRILHIEYGPSLDGDLLWHSGM